MWVKRSLSLSKYVLDDKISYPEETFMDWEFKISVMYDIAKVREGQRSGYMCSATAPRSITITIYFKGDIFDYRFD